MILEKKEKRMGRKGVSKRKPKKNRPSSGADTSGAANARPGKGQTVQSLVQDNRTSLPTGNMNPSSGSKNKNRKGQE
jgi:hypothetical protein